MKLELREYQKEDVKNLKGILLLRNGVGCFNEQRTGKTPTILTLIKEMELKKVLYLTPRITIDKLKRENDLWLGYKFFQNNSLKKDWSEEQAERKRQLVKKNKRKKRDVITWEESLELIELTKKFKNSTSKLSGIEKNELIFKKFNDFSDSKILTITPATASNYFKILSKIDFDIVIIDEAHKIKNHKSKRFKEICIITNKIKYKVAMTGTPVSRHEYEIFGLLHFLYPSKWLGHKYYSFINYYWKTDKNHFGGIIVNGFRHDIFKNEFKSLMKKYSIQRKQKEVMKWLPKKQFEDVYLEVNNKVHEEIQRMYDRFIIEPIKPANKKRYIANEGVLTIRLREIFLDPFILEYDLPSVKFEYIKETYELTPTDKIIVFATSRKFLENCYGKFPENEVGIITGKISTKKAQEYQDRFQNGDLRLLFLQSEAAEVGITLDKADIIIFAEQDYRPEIIKQSMDRATATCEENIKPQSYINLFIDNEFEIYNEGKLIKFKLDKLASELVQNKIELSKVINNLYKKEMGKDERN